MFKSAALEKRRKWPRFSAALPIEYWLINDDSSQGHPGHTVNIGEGGLMVFLSELFKIGEQLKVKLYLGLGSGLHTVEAIAKVVWSKFDLEKEGSYLHGLSFLNVSQLDIKKTVGFLKLISD